MSILHIHTTLTHVYCTCWYKPIKNTYNIKVKDLSYSWNFNLDRGLGNSGLDIPGSFV